MKYAVLGVFLAAPALAQTVVTVTLTSEQLAAVTAEVDALNAVIAGRNIEIQAQRDAAQAANDLCDTLPQCRDTPLPLPSLIPEVTVGAYTQQEAEEAFQAKAEAAARVVSGQAPLPLPIIVPHVPLEHIDPLLSRNPNAADLQATPPQRLVPRARRSP